MNLLDIPPEITYSIIRYEHPYHLIRGYGRTCKALYNLCNEFKYYLLQNWGFPNLSIMELEHRYLNISISEVVKLSLVYHPIIEVFQPNSISILDCIPVSLKLIIQNAIMARNTDVITYIVSKILSLAEYLITTYIDYIFQLCFLHEYITPLEILLQNIDKVQNNKHSTQLNIELYINVMKIKLGLPFQGFGNYYINPVINNLLWKPETYCEYIVIRYVISGYDTNYSFNQLVGKTHPDDIDDHSMFNLANIVGKDKLATIIRKYIDIPEITLYPGVSTGYINLSTHTNYMSYGKLFFYPELAPKYIHQGNIIGSRPCKVNLAVYYLLSGLYDWYISTILKNREEIEEGCYLAGGSPFEISECYINGKKIKSSMYSYYDRLLPNNNK